MEVSDNEAEMTIESRRIEYSITLLTKNTADHLTDNDYILDYLDILKLKYKLAPEFCIYVLFCSLFPPSRNMIKNWSINEDAFV